MAVGPMAMGAGLVSMVSDLLNPDNSLIGNTIQLTNPNNPYNAKSLTQKARQCFIESRVWVDKSIEHEKVISPLLKFTLALQASLVIASLGLDGLVESGITISDRLRSVSSESFIDTADLLKRDSLNLENVGMESWINPSNENIHWDDRSNQKAIDRLQERREELMNALRNSGNDHGNDNAYKTELVEIDKQLKELTRLRKIETSEVTMNTDSTLPVGKIIEVTMRGPNGAEYKIPLYIRLNPYMVDPELAGYMLETAGLAFTSDKRKLMLDAKEITFWRDYVCSADQMDRMRKLLAKDKHGEFTQFIAQNSNKDATRIWQTLHAIANKGYKTSSNLANSVLVFSEYAITEGELHGGVSLHNYNERQRFFDKSYASIIYVIDPSHEQVTMYLNGFRDAGHYTYSDFIRKKDLDGDNFMSVLRTISSGNISRF